MSYLRHSHGVPPTERDVRDIARAAASPSTEREPAPTASSARRSSSGSESSPSGCPPGARPPPRSPDAAPPLPMIPPPSRFPRATVPGLGGNLVVSTRIARNTSSSVAISGPYPAASGSRSNAAAACVAAAYAATSDAAPSTTRAARCAARRRRTPAADTPASLSLGLVHASAARWDPLGTDRGDAHEASPSPSRTTAPGEAGRTRRRRRRRNARIRALRTRPWRARDRAWREESRGVARLGDRARRRRSNDPKRKTRRPRRRRRARRARRRRRTPPPPRRTRGEGTRRGGRRERRGGGGARRVKTAAFVLRRVFLRSARAGASAGRAADPPGGSRRAPRRVARRARRGGKYPPTCADAVGACRGNGNGNEATATGGRRLRAPIAPASGDRGRRSLRPIATADVDRSAGRRPRTSAPIAPHSRRSTRPLAPSVPRGCRRASRRRRRRDDSSPRRRRRRRASRRSAPPTSSIPIVPRRRLRRHPLQPLRDDDTNPTRTSTSARTVSATRLSSPSRGIRGEARRRRSAPPSTRWTRTTAKRLLPRVTRPRARRASPIRASTTSGPSDRLRGDFRGIPIVDAAKSRVATATRDDAEESPATFAAFAASHRRDAAETTARIISRRYVPDSTAAATVSPTVR